MKLYIYGAKSIAIGLFNAISTLYPKHNVEGFIVSSLSNNPTKLCGRSVFEIGEILDKDICILVATPENYHKEIKTILISNGFTYYVFINSIREEKIMGKYYEKTNKFFLLKNLPQYNIPSSLEVLVVKHHKDKVLKEEYQYPFWMKSIQVGSIDSMEGKEGYTDNVDDNISSRNKNYCELTALYWMWKNIIMNNCNRKEFYGLVHYRRFLDLSEDDLLKLKGNEVDVVLPYPMLCEPAMKEHHTRYISESDWDVMIEALENLYPEYGKVAEVVFEQQYMYNYNIIIATPEVIEEYCKWLFDILEYVYQNSSPKGDDRCDRYIGYLGESLLTLFFMYNKNKYKIFHAGRRMLV